MAENGKRSYSSAVRDSQARQTRRQIVAAAGRLYAEHGFAATTIDAIAAEAGVSRKTVFTSVGGKVALLKLAYDYAMAGDDEPVPMIDREGLRTIIAEPDPHQQMHMYAELVTGMGERISDLWLALRGAAEIDAEAKELYTRWEQERMAGMRNGPVRDLLAKDAIRSDLTPDEAAAIFWVLVDPAVYHRFVVEAGWSRDRFRDWLDEAFQTQVLAPGAGTKRPGSVATGTGGRNPAQRQPSSGAR